MTLPGMVYVHASGAVKCINDLPFVATHDNGGRPFLVSYDKKKAYVGRLVSMKSDRVSSKRSSSTIGINIYTYQHKWTFPYRKLFIGVDKTTKMRNSVLINVSGNLYIFIGDWIYAFSTKHPVKRFVSEIRGSDVVYPYAEDASSTYLLMDAVKHDGHFDSPYDAYWDKKAGWKKMSKKVIQKGP